VFRLHLAHDESKDRDFEIEMSWICAESGMRHEHVPAQLLSEAVQSAQDAQRDEMQD
jgi:20S proteasome subunit alpha 7